MASLAEFFAGKNVFLTGVSGFVGKVLVEKLLRSCPQVEAIYVLIRDKRGKSAEQRVAKILEDKLFDLLQATNPESLSKVKIISGDLLEPKIVSQEKDRQLLFEKINVVIHSAASVRFNEPLRDSVEVNLRATLKVLELATAMKALKSFVHVSTAYSHCYLEKVEEKLYPCNMEPRQLMSLCDWMSNELLEELTPKLLEDRPNTYTYTKALAENLVGEYIGQLPIVIVRPSIITGAMTEPLPGWVDNYNGPNGLMVALGTGVLTTLYTHLECIADLIPVDFVANTILAAARRAPDGFKVYNCTSSTHNPIKWGTFIEEGVKFVQDFPLASIVRYPESGATSVRLLHQTRLFFKHYLVARVLDMGLRLVGKKPALLPIYRRLANSMDLLEFFITHEWHIHNDNTRALFDELSAADQTEFNFNAASIDWLEYVQTYCNGIRRFILKEDEGNLEQRRRRLTRVKYMGYATNALVALTAWKTLCALLPCSELTGLC